MINYLLSQKFKLLENDEFNHLMSWHIVSWIFFFLFSFADMWLQESQNGGESQKEAPLVDLSNPKEEETKEKASEPKTDEAVPVSVEAGKETAKTTEGKVEVPAANNSEEKKVEASNETKKPVEGQAEAKVQKPDANNKSDAPLATVWWHFRVIVSNKNHSVQEKYHNDWFELVCWD